MILPERLYPFGDSDRAEYKKIEITDNEDGTFNVYAELVYKDHPDGVVIFDYKNCYTYPESDTFYTQTPLSYFKPYK